jgi:hypothetical protein
MTNEPTLTVDECGTKRWILNGKLHREDGPALEYSNGDKAWYINDKLHRLYGPAVERTSGYKAWYLNEKRHREDGPAVECSDGTKWWWFDGEFISYKELDPDEWRRLVLEYKLKNL